MDNNHKLDKAKFNHQLHNNDLKLHKSNNKDLYLVMANNLIIVSKLGLKVHMDSNLKLDMAFNHRQDMVSPNSLSVVTINNNNL